MSITDIAVIPNEYMPEGVVTCGVETSKRLQKEINALTAERDMLRTALIATGRNLGAGLADNVPNEFLALVPHEALIVYKRSMKPHER